MKKIKISLIFIALIISVLIIFGLTTNSHGNYGGVGKFTQFAHKGYFGVKDLAFDGNATLGDNGSDWNNCNQIMCIHNPSESIGYCKLKAIVTINADGSAVVETSAGTVDVASSDENKKMAKFAYEAEQAGDSGTSYVKFKYPFAYYWHTTYRSYLLTAINNVITLPSVGNADLANVMGGATKFESTIAGYDQTEYEAKLFIFSNGGAQARVVVFGNQGDNTTKVKIDKYITSVSNLGDVGDRSGQSDSLKRSIPVDIDTSDEEIGTVDDIIITYKVVITNIFTEDISGTYTDTSDSELEHKTGTFTEAITIAAGGTKEYTITCKLTSCNAGTIYENKAQFTYDTDKTISSSDYVRGIEDEDHDDPPESEGNGTINKYIIKVNGVDVSENRSGFSESKKDEEPVEVKKGDIVTYRVEFKNEIGRAHV